MSGYRENKSRIGAEKIVLTNANVPTQMPSLTIPDGYSIVLKATDTNAGNIFIADNAGNVGNGAKRFALTRGQGISLQIIELNIVYVMASAAGDSIEYIVEQ